MKYNTLIIFLFTIFTLGCASNKPAVTSEFMEASRFHEKVAILPFSVNFNEDYKRTLAQRNTRARESNYWEETAKFAGMDMQKSMFANMAKQIKKGRYELVIQDFVSTNKALEQAQIPYRGLASVDKALLAKQLGVDAIIYGEALVNVDYRSFNRGGVETKLSIYDARTGQRVWMDELTEQANSYTDTPDGLASRTVEQMSKRLPYMVVKR